MVRTQHYRNMLLCALVALLGYATCCYSTLSVSKTFLSQSQVVQATPDDDGVSSGQDERPLPALSGCPIALDVTEARAVKAKASEPVRPAIHRPFSPRAPPVNA